MDLENKYGTLEIQRNLLKLLYEFDSFCQKEGIQYSVSSGTLLGAVRHKGFIPWDDDLDVNITRENYNKLKQRITEGSSLQFVDAEDTQLWISRIHLLNGVDAVQDATLDLLILDNAPDDPIKDKIQLYHSLMLQGMLKKRPTINKGSGLLRLCSIASWLVGLPFSSHIKMQWYHNLAQRYNNIETKNKAIWMDQFKALWYRYPRKVVEKTIRLPFENIEVSGWAEYDNYLRIAFGNDYMTPPKESERVPLHTNIQLNK